MSSWNGNGFTGGNDLPVGIVHGAEYVIPAYQYPAWTHWIRPAFLKRIVRRPFRKRNPITHAYVRSLLERGRK